VGPLQEIIDLTLGRRARRLHHPCVCDERRRWRLQFDVHFRGRHNRGIEAFWWPHDFAKLALGVPGTSPKIA